MVIFELGKERKQTKMFFVLLRAWDKEKILSLHEESNSRPSDSSLRCSTTEPQRLYKHDVNKVADRSSMQDTCHKNFNCNRPRSLLSLCGSVRGIFLPTGCSIVFSVFQRTGERVWNLREFKGRGLRQYHPIITPSSDHEQTLIIGRIQYCRYHYHLFIHNFSICGIQLHRSICHILCIEFLRPGYQCEMESDQQLNCGSLNWKTKHRAHPQKLKNIRLFQVRAGKISQYRATYLYLIESLYNLLLRTVPSKWTSMALSSVISPCSYCQS